MYFTNERDKRVVLSFEGRATFLFGIKCCNLGKSIVIWKKL